MLRAAGITPCPQGMTTPNPIGYKSSYWPEPKLGLPKPRWEYDVKARRTLCKSEKTRKREAASAALDAI